MNSPWYSSPAAQINQQSYDAALARQKVLTKPQGSLGDLEDIALQFAAWQGDTTPVCERILVRVFAGDHGVCEQGVSAFPQQVTGQMIANFVTGGAAISVLSKRLDADFAVVNMGTATPVKLANDAADAAKLVNIQLMPGTKNFTKCAAMTTQVLEQALAAGRDQVAGFDGQLFIGGEMGIGNTTSASAIYSLLLKLPPETTVGPGTGVDKDGMAIKRKTIYQAFNFHATELEEPLSALQNVGGLEIAALVGAYICAAQQGVPILVDGFITTAAALMAVEINPTVRNWMIFSHKSAEPAHAKALDALNAKPLLDLGMRLGEGSGAATAVPLIQSALALHSQMATFEDAGVSNAD